jgi:two-component system, chemotaxis family, protein-glutamate methylesterase/glutaminase
MPFGVSGKLRLERGAKIRVLVVDDSVVIRRLVTQALSEDPQIEVAGTASNGALALKSLATNMVDVVTLDIEMPEMDGVATLRAIRKLYPCLIVIMFSTLSERGAAITIEALAAGANDYATKAANVGSLDKSMMSLREVLIPKLKQFFELPSKVNDSASEIARPGVLKGFGNRGSVAANGSANVYQKRAGLPNNVPGRHMKAVLFGVSTGGPNALADVLPMFPANFGLPILIVQHMPPMFTRILAERLREISQVKVVEAEDQMLLQAGTAYIAPGDFHMRVVKNGIGHKLVLDKSEHENSCRPAVDVLFRSAAETFGGSVVAAILTGMGRDGLRGVERLRTAGAFVVAQDEMTSVVWGMPGSVVRAGLADAVVPLKSVVPTIQKGCE